MDSLVSVGQIVAYFDPGSGSLVLQAIVGGTAGLVVFAKYMWETMPAFLWSRKVSEDVKAT